MEDRVAARKAAASAAAEKTNALEPVVVKASVAVKAVDGKAEATKLIKSHVAEAAAEAKQHQVSARTRLVL